MLAENLSPPCYAALIFGGDGTLHRHLPALVRHRIPALVVPCGSGNDFARALGLSRPEQALAAWKRFAGGANNVRLLDVAAISRANSLAETLCCNVAGVGLDSDANRRANAMPRWLRTNGGYVLAALASLVSYREQLVTIYRSDDGSNFLELYTGSALVAAFCNNVSYGGGFRIAPRALPDDGLLDLCLIKPVDRRRRLHLFPRVFRGTHLGMKEVEYVQAAAFRVESAGPLSLYADGEPAGTTPFEVRVRPQALTVIVP